MPSKLAEGPGPFFRQGNFNCAGGASGRFKIGCALGPQWGESGVNRGDLADSRTRLLARFLRLTSAGLMQWSGSQVA